MDSLVDSLLAYRANAPIIDQLLTEAGFPNNGGLVSTLLGGATAAPVASEAPATPPAQPVPEAHSAYKVTVKGTE